MLSSINRLETVTIRVARETDKGDKITLRMHFYRSHFHNVLLADPIGYVDSLVIIILVHSILSTKIVKRGYQGPVLNGLKSKSTSPNTLPFNRLIVQLYICISVLRIGDRFH